MGRGKGGRGCTAGVKRKKEERGRRTFRSTKSQKGCYTKGPGEDGNREGRRVRKGEKNIAKKRPWERRNQPSQLRVREKENDGWVVVGKKTTRGGSEKGGRNEGVSSRCVPKVYSIEEKIKGGKTRTRNKKKKRAKKKKRSEPPKRGAGPKESLRK